MSEARFHGAHVQCLDYQRDSDIYFGRRREPLGFRGGCAGAESRKGEVKEGRREGEYQSSTVYSQ